jgi:GDP-mannose 6-dehydrogenase
MKINVFGLGYVGSVSAACLAAGGHEVVGIDIDRTKIDTINRGDSIVIEQDLPELISRAVASGKLRAAAEPLLDADVSLVSVGTPSNENGSLCLDHVFRAAAQIGGIIKNATAYHVVCIRSTVLPGTVEKCIMPILERHAGKKAGEGFGVVMNPEFLREGSSIRDYYHPPFTIIGELDARSGDTVEQLFTDVAGPKIRTPIATAEMVKYAGNAYHALKVSFANELGNLCKRLGLDGRSVMDIFCRDEKLNVSAAYLQPGFAFGGSCLPKDVRALLYRAKELDLEAPVLQSILPSNTHQIDEAYRMIRRTGKKKIAMLGLSFKPGTDDLRESPIAELTEMLIGKGYQVSIYDREVSLVRLHGSNKLYIEQTIPHISGLMKPTVDAALEGAELVIVAKRSPEFEEAIARLDGEPAVIDLASMRADFRGRRGGYEGICW